MMSVTRADPNEVASAAFHERPTAVVAVAGAAVVAADGASTDAGADAAVETDALGCEALPHPMSSVAIANTTGSLRPRRRPNSVVIAREYTEPKTGKSG